MVDLVCLYISFSRKGKEGERKQDLPRANFNDFRFLFVYEVNKLLVWQRVDKCFLDFDLQAVMQKLLRRKKTKRK